MNNEEKLNYIIKVVKSCKTRKQLSKGRYWAFKLIERMDISYLESFDYKHRVIRCNII